MKDVTHRDIAHSRLISGLLGVCKLAASVALPEVEWGGEGLNLHIHRPLRSEEYVTCLSVPFRFF